MSFSHITESLMWRLRRRDRQRKSVLQERVSDLHTAISMREAESEWRIYTHLISRSALRSRQSSSLHFLRYMILRLIIQRSLISTRCLQSTVTMQHSLSHMYVIQSPSYTRHLRMTKRWLLREHRLHSLISTLVHIHMLHHQILQSVVFLQEQVFLLQISEMYTVSSRHTQAV